MKSLRITFSADLPVSPQIEAHLSLLRTEFFQGFKIGPDNSVIITDMEDDLRFLMDKITQIKQSNISAKQAVGAVLDSEEGDPFSANAVGWQIKVCQSVEKMEFVD